MRFRSCAITTTLAAALSAGRGQTAEPAVTITLDASRTGGQLRPAWRFFGGDHVSLLAAAWSRRLSLKFPLARRAVSMITLRW